MHPQGWGKLNVHIAQLWAHVRLCARRKWVISAILTVVRLLPVFPQLQTCRCTALTDAMCHEATRTEAFAPAFRAGRFPGFPKKSPPCRQWIGNENPRRDLGARDRRSPLRRRMSRIAKGHSFGPAV